MKCYTIEVVFFEDFTITVEVNIARAEPDVGVMNDYIEEWEIVRVDDCGDKTVLKFFQDKIENSKALIDHWFDALNDGLCNEGFW